DCVGRQAGLFVIQVEIRRDGIARGGIAATAGRLRLRDRRRAATARCLVGVLTDAPRFLGIALPDLFLDRSVVFHVRISPGNSWSADSAPRAFDRSRYTESHCIGRAKVRSYGDPLSGSARGIFNPAYNVRRGPYDGEKTPIPLPLRI